MKYARIELWFDISKCSQEKKIFYGCYFDDNSPDCIYIKMPNKNTWSFNRESVIAVELKEHE